MAELPSGTVTFLFTDIEGSTAHWEQAPEAMRVALARHDALIRAAIQEHGGHVVKTMGDGFHAAFAHTPDALAAALDAQRRLAAEPWGEVGPLRVRIALHTGAAEERDGDYYGPTLNRAARLVSAGHGGQILLFEVVAGLVNQTLPDGVRLLDLGRHRLKDLTEPERVFQVVAADLVSDFPPLASLDARPHNLPTHPTALLGRERELAEVCGLFEDGARLVTLTGPGGTGKTRLGLQVAADLLDDFEHGVFLVELGPTSDPALVPSTIAQTLGVRDVGSRPIVDLLKQHLRERSVLLLLDNFEQVLTAASVVADLMAACPGVAGLATSREPLRLRGEHEYGVPPLALPEPRQEATVEVASTSPAVALFVQRAQAIRSDFALTDLNAPDVAELCRRLDGLPLAIELAAAHVRLLSPQMMVGRLERRLQLLAGGARDLPRRQRTLRDTITWSHDLLDEEERRLFRRLAVFVGGWTLQAAEAVGASDDGGVDVLEGLESLVSKSLVRQRTGVDSEPRFAMLETIREYALERLEASGEEAAAGRRHAEHHATLAEEAELELRGPHQVAWLDRLEAEHDNLRAALHWAIEHDDVELGLRVGAALWRFWYVRSHLSEGRRWLTALTAVRGVSMRAAAHSQVLIGLGSIVYRQGDPRTARSLFEDCLFVAREVGDERGTADALGSLGFVAQNQGDYEAARALHLQALAIRRERGDEWGIAGSLGNLAWIHRMEGEHEAARSLHHEALLIRRRLGDKEGIAESLSGLAWLAQDRNELSVARAYYDEALAIRREQGDKGGVAGTLGGLAWLAQNQGDHAVAHALYDEALTISRDLGDTWRTELLLSDLAWLFQAERDYAQARVLHAEALALASEMEDQWGIADALKAFAMLALAGGEPQRASRLFGAAAVSRDDSGMQLSPTERATHDRAVADTAAKLGEAAFAAAWAEGQAMTLEQAVAYALEERPSA